MLKGKKMKNTNTNQDTIEKICLCGNRECKAMGRVRMGCKATNKLSRSWDEVDMRIEGLSRLADIPYMISLIKPFAKLDNKFYYNDLNDTLTGMMAVIIRENLSGKFEEMVNEEYKKEFNKYFIVNKGE